MKTTIALAAAVGAGIALALASGATQAQESKTEKCYGVGSSRVDLQACKLEYSIVSPK